MPARPVPASDPEGADDPNTSIGPALDDHRAGRLTEDDEVAFDALMSIYVSMGVTAPQFLEVTDI